VRSIILLLIALSISLYGRSNPFVGTDEIGPMSDNNQKILKYFYKDELYLPQEARILKYVKLFHQNYDGSIEQVIRPINAKIDWHEPIIIKQNSQAYRDENREYRYDFVEQKFSGINFVTFLISKTAILLKTKDTLLCEFMLTKPYRLVVDFERDAVIKPKNKKLFDTFFTHMVLGNHSGYYRIVLYLDNYYDYKLTLDKKGPLIELIE
jgi:hypothetical protein